MAEVTRVPLRPIANGSLFKLWLGVIIAVLLAGGIAWAAVPKGVSVETLTAGEGDNPQDGDVVFVRYTGTLATGEVFEQTQAAQWPIPGILPDGTPLLLQEGAVIDGFYEGLLQAQRGGVYEIFIPAEDAYGANPPPGSDIPANADLTFNIELVDFMSEDEAQQRFGMMQQMLLQGEGAGEGASGAAGAPGTQGGDIPPPAAPQ